jgi:Molybdopterin-binding domain of aldehyde dehydrogenase
MGAAQVAEVTVAQNGQIKVDRVVCAVDCGTPINPDVIVAQMEGGIGFGLGAALYGAITLKDGKSNRPTSTAIRSCASTKCRRSRCISSSRPKRAYRCRRTGRGPDRTGCRQRGFRRQGQAAADSAVLRRRYGLRTGPEPNLLRSELP